MAHEELKKQYVEDCLNYERPWKLWEIRSSQDTWCPCTSEPGWLGCCQYRRKEPPFDCEYFSGLNWREAEKYVGKMMEFSDDPDCDGWIKGKLISLDYREGLRFESESESYEYCRTCLETFQHPTIPVTVHGKTYELPKPETEAPKKGTIYWSWFPHVIRKCLWHNTPPENIELKAGMIHLTEARAQAWVNFWREIHA